MNMPCNLGKTCKLGESTWEIYKYPEERCCGIETDTTNISCYPCSVRRFASSGPMSYHEMDSTEALYFGWDWWIRLKAALDDRKRYCIG